MKSSARFTLPSTKYKKSFIEAARQLGIKKVLVTCDETNTASRKIIEHCGGVLENARSQGKGKPKKLRFWIANKNDKSPGERRIMIYLIGGAPRVGKSIMAKKLAQATKSACISTDKICETVMAAMTPKQRAIKFPLPSFSGDPSENILKPEERVNLQIISARSLESEIDRIIANAIHAQKSLIIEGIQILPDHAQILMKKYGGKKICSVFIASNNINRIIDGITKNTNPENWLKESDEAVIRQVAEFIAAFTSYVRREAEDHSCLYRERTDDFETDVKFVERLRFQF